MYIWNQTRPGPPGNGEMGGGVDGGKESRGGKRPSGNVSVTEDFLEEESVDQGSDGKGMRIPIKKGGWEVVHWQGRGGRKGYSEAE